MSFSSRVRLRICCEIDCRRSSMRVVTDFGDPDKIDAVIAGGVSERHFQPHQNDQARLLVANERRAWWFNPAKAEANAKSTLQLVP